MKSKRWLAACFLAAGLGAACGGGGGGGPTQPPPPPPPTPGITFTASGGAGANSIALASGAGGTTTTMVLEIRANDVQDLYGLSFDLAYPQQQLRYDGPTEGTFLNQSGAQTSLQVAPGSGAGTLVVGLTRLGGVTGVTGSGVLLSLRFTAIGAGSGNFGFSRNSTFKSDGTTVGSTWSAGSVNVVL